VIALRGGVVLPLCEPGEFAGIALVSGAIGAFLQLALYLIFRRSKHPVLMRSPGYSAHSVVACGFMLGASIIGTVGWLNPPVVAATAGGRLLVPSDSARWLAAVVFGMLVGWDLPSSLAIKPLRKVDGLLHHIGMAFVAGVGGTTLPMHYGLFFLGACELSSVPLTIFHQTSKACEIAEQDDDFPDIRLKHLGQLRDTSKVIFAASFLIVRTVWFTRVALFGYVRDALDVLPTDAATGSRFTIYSMLGAIVPFVGLQLYWSWLILKAALNL
jgi:hypothetical protein